MNKSTSEIWEEFNQQLRAFILARIDDPDDADDILQEVFLKIHTRIDTLRDSDRLAPWLYQIARNTIVDHYRARQPVESLPDTLPIFDEPAESDAVTRIARYVGTLVNDLPEKYRQALILTEFEGLTQEAMGQRLGLSPSGAKSRVQRGRDMLREQLLDCCHFEFDRENRLIDYTRRPDCCPECATRQDHDRVQNKNALART